MNGLIGLIDYDSLIYKAVYKIVSIQDIKQKIAQGKSREELEQWIVDECINRLCQMGDKIFAEIEKEEFLLENGLEIVFCEYFITYGKNSIRRRLVSDYKKTRRKQPQDKWVNKVRSYLIKSDFAFVHDEWEADDLIHDRALELGQNGCIVISIDKDLKQIPGIHFDFYRKPSKEVDQWGQRIQNDMKGLKLVTESEAAYNFWYQMLVGDGSDNVKGVKGIGPSKATKLLNNHFQMQKGFDDYRELILSEYQRVYKKFWKYQYDKNYFLLRLGVRDVNKPILPFFTKVVSMYQLRSKRRQNQNKRLN